MVEVLHLIDTYRIGGPGKTILNSAKYIDTTRFRVHVGSFTHPDPARNEFARAAIGAGIPYLELPETGRLNVDHVWRIRRYVKSNDIAIVHAHGYRTDAFGFLATRGLPAACVTTHHGWIRNTPHEERMAKVALQLCRLFDGVEVVSQALLEEVPRSLRDRGRAVLVHNGIVLEDYRPAGHREPIRRQLNVPAEAVLIGVVGRLSIEKGCLEMLDAFRAIVAQVPAAQLVFVGEGPLEARLRERAHELALGGRVHLTGHQTPVQPYYEAMDLLVSPSRTEGLSNALLEAMATRRPIVATRVGGTPELVAHEVNGLLVPSEQPDALAAAVVRLLGDAELRERLVAGGTRRVEGEFSFAARMRKEESFYEAVLGARPRGATTKSVSESPIS